MGGSFANRTREKERKKEVLLHSKKFGITTKFYVILLDSLTMAIAFQRIVEELHISSVH